LNQLYAYSSSNVSHIELTSSMLSEEGEIYGVNHMIDDILAQKSVSKSFLQQEGTLQMGIGCACTPEKIN